jgi:hypothetical protein
MYAFAGARNLERTGVGGEFAMQWLPSKGYFFQQRTLSTHVYGQ